MMSTTTTTTAIIEGTSKERWQRPQRNVDAQSLWGAIYKRHSL